jgi:hypothetical protein
VEAMIAGTLARLGNVARERMERLEQTAGIDKVIGGAEDTKPAATSTKRQLRRKSR